MNLGEIFLDSVIDCTKMLPFIFITYVLIEIVERKAAFARRGKFLEGRSAVLLGSLAGAFPQCGVSVMSAKLFEKGLIGVGTLLAVFISTSDEAFTILISSDKRLALLPLVILKIALGIAVGLILNAIVKRRSESVGEDDFDHEDVCAHCHDHVHAEGKHSWISKYVFVPLLHSAQTFLYLFAVIFAFGILFGEEGFFGEKLEDFLTATRYFAPFISALIGLIPNCASSAVITSAYVSGAISFGAMFTGLCANAGVGFAVLFRSAGKLKRNLLILVALYLIGALSGLALTLLDGVWIF